MGFSINQDRILEFFQHFCEKNREKMRRPQKKGFELQNDPKSEDPEKFWEPILRPKFVKNWKNHRSKNR